MSEHLVVAVHPFEERDALADLERRVLAELNPPLNLEGRPASEIQEGAHASAGRRARVVGARTRRLWSCPEGCSDGGGAVSGARV